MPHSSLPTGCKILCYPGAFNMTTGPTHWELLLRSRYYMIVYSLTLSGIRDFLILYDIVFYVCPVQKLHVPCLCFPEGESMKKRVLIACVISWLQTTITLIWQRYAWAQGSNVKGRCRKWGGPSCPKCPTFNECGVWHQMVPIKRVCVRALTSHSTNPHSNVGPVHHTRC